MAKDPFPYFQHDSNARSDPKLVAFCAVYKNNGYAAFFKTIEVLRDQKDYRLPKLLVASLKTTWESFGDLLTMAEFEAMLKLMVDLGLLQDDGSFIYSQSLIDRMKRMLDARARQSEGGRRGAQARWGDNGNPLPTHCTPNASLLKVIKDKVIKDNKSFNMKRADLWSPWAVDNLKALINEQANDGFELPAIKMSLMGLLIPESIIDRAMERKY